MVSDRLTDRLRLWFPADSDNYADEEDRTIDIWLQVQEVNNAVQRIPVEFQQPVVERLQRGEALAFAYAHVRGEYAGRIVDGLSVELNTLLGDMPALMAAFERAQNLYLWEDAAAYRQYSVSAGYCKRCAQSEVRLFTLLEWFDTPEYLHEAILDLQHASMRISRGALEIDDMNAWSQGNGNRSWRDPSWDERWSVMWGDKDVYYGGDVEYLPYGFHTIPDFHSHDWESFEIATSMWVIKRLRLRRALHDLCSGTARPVDFLIPNKYDQFEHDLLMWLNGLCHVDEDNFTPEQWTKWSNFREDILECHESRHGSMCDYLDSEGCILCLFDGRVYTIEDDSETSHGRVVSERPSWDVLEWLADHEHKHQRLSILPTETEEEAWFQDTMQDAGVSSTRI